MIFGFVLALLLAIMRLSNVRPFRFLGLTKDGHLRDGGFLMVLSRFNPVSFIATAYVEIFRSTPYGGAAVHDLLRAWRYLSCPFPDLRLYSV